MKNHILEFVKSILRVALFAIVSSVLTFLINNISIFVSGFGLDPQVQGMVIIGLTTALKGLDERLHKADVNLWGKYARTEKPKDAGLAPF